MTNVESTVTRTTYDREGKPHPTRMLNLTWISDADIDRVIDLVRPRQHKEDCRRQVIVSLSIIAHGDFDVDPAGVAMGKLRQTIALTKKMQGGVKRFPTYVMAGKSPLRIAAELQLDKLTHELDRFVAATEALGRRLVVKRSGASRISS